MIPLYQLLVVTASVACLGQVVDFLAGFSRLSSLSELRLFGSGISLWFLSPESESLDEVG